MGKWDTMRRGRARHQSSIPFGQVPDDALDARGLLLSGVVVATYVVDDPSHPYAEGTPYTGVSPVSVYCDVLVYSNLSGVRTKFLPRVRVSQARGGMHDGEVWKPRAARFDVGETAAFEADAAGNPKGLNPANLDGDHVLVGFLNNRLDEPIVLRGLPHPSADEGAEENLEGHRLRLRVADGDPHFVRHHGTYFGVDDSGDFLVSTVGAYSDEPGADGTEPPQDNTKGNQTLRLPLDAAFVVELVDGQGDRTQAPLPYAKLEVTRDQVHLTLNGETLLLQSADGTATLKLGDGAVKVAIADHLQTFWGTVKAWMDTHVHPGVAPGPSSTAPPALASPGYDTSIGSSKVTIPDG